MLVQGQRAAPAPVGEGGSLERAVAGSVEPPAPPDFAFDDPRLEEPPPLPETADLPMPEPEPPEPAPDLEVVVEPLAETERLPEEAPVERPFEPHPADVGRRVRSKTLPPAPLPLPPPSRPAPSAPVPPPAGRPPLRELARPHPPVPPGVPSDRTLALLLEYTVAADGRVSDARVTRSSGWPLLDESTRTFVMRHWLYEAPGEERRFQRWVRFRPGM